MFMAWWRSVLTKLVNRKSASKRRRRRLKGSHESSYRIWFEPLEDRMAPAAHAFTWVGGTSTGWTTLANWTEDGGAAADYPGHVTEADTVLFNSNPTYQPTLAADVNIASITFQSGNITIGGSNTITLSASPGIVGNATSATTDTISAKIALGINQNWNVSSPNSLTVSGNVSGAFNLTANGTGQTTISGILGTGAGTVTNSGAGTLTLSGANTFTGAVSITAGTIQAANANTALGNNTVTLSTNTKLQLAGGIALSNAIASTTTSTIESVTGNNTLSGQVSLTLSNPTNVTMQADQSANLIMSNVIGAAHTNGCLTFAGGGNITFTPGATSFSTGAGNGVYLNDIGTGTVNITAPLYGTAATPVATINAGGTVMFTGTGALNSTTAGCIASNVTNNGSLVFGNSTTTGNQTASGVISGSGNVTQGGTGTLTLSNTNTYTGSTIIGGTGTLAYNADTNFGNTTSGNAGSIIFNANGTLALGGSFSTIRNITVSANVTGSITGAYTLTDNTGTITVNSGAIFAPSANVTLAGNGTLTGNGTAKVTHTGNASGDLTNQYASTLTRTLTNLTMNFAGAANQTVDALTYGSLSFSNSGCTANTTGNATVNGNLTVNASGNFTAASTSTITMGNGTISNSGTLAFQNLTIAGNVAVAAAGNITVAGTVNVNSGGTLNGSGTANQGYITVSGLTTINSSGTIASGGVSNAIILSGGLTLQGSSTSAFTLNAPTGNSSPLINVNGGTFAVNANNTITLIAGTGFGQGTYDLFQYTGSTDPTITNFTPTTGQINGFSYQIQDNTTNHEIDLVVSSPATTTTVTSAPNPSVYGQSVTFTATVTGSGTPTGTVTFKDGSTSLGTASLPGSGTCTFSTTSLTAATHTITANYGGNAAFGGSTGTLTGGQTVSQASTTTTVTASSGGISVFGQTVTFTATVTVTPPGGRADGYGDVPGQQHIDRDRSCQQRHGNIYDQCAAVDSGDAHHHCQLRGRHEFQRQHHDAEFPADGESGEHDDDGDIVDRQHVGVWPERDVHGDGESAVRGDAVGWHGDVPGQRHVDRHGLIERQRHVDLDARLLPGGGNLPDHGDLRRGGRREFLGQHIGGLQPDGDQGEHEHDDHFVGKFDLWR